MMKNKNLIGLFFVSLIFSHFTMAQQLSTQGDFEANIFLQNPAMTAPFYEGNFGVTHRVFSTGFENQPYTFTAFGQYPLDEMSVGLGFQRDVFGIWQQDIFQATYAYKLDFGVGQSPQLALGISAGFLNSTFNLQNIIANDPNDPLMPNTINTNLSTIFSTGLYFTTTDRAHEEHSYLSIGMAGRIVLPKEELFFTAQQNALQKRVVHANVIIKYRKINDFNYFYLEPSIWLDYTDNIKLLSPVFQFQLGHSEIFGLGMRYRFLGDVSVQFSFKTQSFWDNIPLTVGVNVIRPDNQKGIGLGYGIFLQYSLDTY